MEHSVFAKNNQTLDPGNYDQFEVDDAKSKLQVMPSWNWEPASWSCIFWAKKIVASHELTLSSSCLITAERLDNLLNHQIKSKMNSKRRTWKLWVNGVQVTVKSWYMASCITDRMHWLICLENESCFPWKLCTPKTLPVTYCKHTAETKKHENQRENQRENLYVQTVFTFQISDSEHLCFPRVPVEDLPQFIARSRFESAGMPYCLYSFISSWLGSCKASGSPMGYSLGYP